MAKILILIAAHLSTAPRAQKEAKALSDTGHDVTILGVWFDPVLAGWDQLLCEEENLKYVAVLDFRPGIQSWQKSFAIRLKNRIAREGYKYFKIFSPRLLGYGVCEMLTAAHQARADLTIVHSEAGLWIGNKLLDQGFNVGVDFEDWFSEDLLPEARVYRPIKQLKKYEQRLAQECSYYVTTSMAMAVALSKSFKSRRATVIYNMFPWSDRNAIDKKKRNRRNFDLPSLHWFSQTIGKGRGLEVLFEALSLLSIKFQVHLRGKCNHNTRQWITSQLPGGWEDQVFIHETVSNGELLSRISEHDIGLALETGYCPSRDLTITNKLFQYMQAGLAIVASDTAGQREILASCPDAGQLIPKNDPLSLAKALEALVSDQERLNHAKKSALKAAEEKYCWEKQNEVLVRAAEVALNKKC